MKNVSYALGLSMAHNFLSSGIKNLDIERFAKALQDVYNGVKPEFDDQQTRMYVNQYFAELQEKAGEENKKEGAAFLAENAKNEKVITTKSGLQYEIVVEGKGEKPSATSTVRCHYEGRLINGTVFDSSYRRNQPADFPVNQVIAGWTEALQLMPVGSKWRLFIPSNLAYGEHGAGEAIAPNSTLIFDVELLEIVK